MDGLTSTRSARAAETLLFAFLATVVMLFAGFTSAYLIRRTGSDWARLELPPLALANTLVLLASSVTLELARRRHRTWTRATLALGLLFLLSLVHGLHLAGGLGALGWLTARDARPRLAAVYWHFLGLAWLYVLWLLRLS